MTERQIRARQIRENAAELAYLRVHPTHVSNGEEFQYRNLMTEDDNGNKKLDNQPTYIANFTKGLPHCTVTGLLLEPNDYRQFVLGIQSGDPQDFVQTRLGSINFIENQNDRYKKKPLAENWESQIAKNGNVGVRAWESAGAGLTFELEGFDPQAVTMPPAPVLDSPELAGEMAEVYLQALLRDVPFSQLREAKDGETAPEAFDSPEQILINVDDAVNVLNNINGDRNWFNADCCELTAEERQRQRPELRLRPDQPENQQIDVNNIFRGVSAGVEKGPYISQFLLIGNQGVNSRDDINKVNNGLITYGSVTINQQVRFAEPFKDYMTTFEAYIDVQNGANLGGFETYVGDNKNTGYRFMATPRDLATYVHYDALYEAYLNACLIMLANGVPFDPGLPFGQPDVQDKQQGFAQFGGPHILSLVCEVATRALKAVRYQKFNIHRRLRPEAVGGLIDRHQNIKEPDLRGFYEPIDPLVKAFTDVTVKDGKNLLDIIAQHNKNQNTQKDRCQDESANQDLYLLPMAFAEGSPMHPSYGAGHATVAGACVTILKAFFDHGHIITEPTHCNGKRQYIAYEASNDGSCLREINLNEPLTVEGELNKIAANVSIGRNWAGVHYYSDYIESLRLGEQIAIGILEEQKLTYGENFTMTVPLYDGGTIRI